MVYFALFCEKFPDKPINLVEHFAANVEAAVHGDDCVLTVSELVAPWFNQQSAKYMWKALFHIELTASDKKSGEMPLFSTWENALFLKRRFVLDRTMAFWRAPLEQDVIRDMVLWITDKTRADDIVTANIRTALEEAAQHDSVFFNSLEKDLRRATIAKNLKWTALSMNEYRNRFYRQGSLPIYLYPDFPVTVPSTTLNYLPQGACDLLPEVIPPRSSDKLLRALLLYREISTAQNLECSPGSDVADQAAKIPTTADINASTSNTMETIVPLRSEVGLTTFADVSVPTQDNAPPIPEASFAKSDAGYTGLIPPQSLEHPFKVHSFDWTYANNFGTNVSSVTFPLALTSIPNIAAKLLQYKYFRADVKVEVKVTSTPVRFGALNVSFFPRMGTVGADVDAYATVAQRLNKAYPLSANGQRSIEMILRRVPVSTFDLTIGDPQAIGTLFFDVLAPLRVADGTEPIPLTVVVFAHFISLEVAGPGEQEGVSNLIKVVADRRKVRRDFKKQSKKEAVKETVKKSEDGIVSSLLSFAGNAAPVLAMSPLAELSPFAALLGAAAPFFRSLGLSKPSTTMAVQANNTQRPLRYIGKAQGLYDGERVSTMTDSHLLSTTFADCEEPDIRALAQEPCLLTMMTFDSSSPPETQLIMIPLIPSMCRVSDQLEQSIYAPGNMAYYSQFFNNWRGGFKFSFHFFTSQFTTASVRITHNPYNELPEAPEDSSGDHVSTVVEICGDTIHEFSVPYISREPWSVIDGYCPPSNSPVVTLSPIDNLSITILTPARTLGVVGDSTIYMVVYVAAAPDIDFSNYIGYRLRLAANETGEMLREKRIEVDRNNVIKRFVKQSIAERFSKPFKPLHPALAAMEQGFVSSENSTNLCALCHMEEFVLPAETITPPISSAETVYTGIPNFLGTTNIAALTRPFRFWRGSTRHRMYNQLLAVYTGVGMSVPPSYLSSANLRNDPCPMIPIANATLSDPIEIPWPFMTPIRAMIPASLDNAEYLNNYNPRFSLYATFANYRELISMGDDFQVAVRTPPPLQVVLHPSTLARRKSKVASLASSHGQSSSSEELAALLAET